MRRLLLLGILFIGVYTSVSAEGSYEKCKQGYGEECYKLGYMYIKGEEVKKNINKALDYYRQSCNKGHPRGCTVLGIFYERGEMGIKQNYSIATEYYAKGCDGNDDFGCHGLGVMYYNGKGIHKDISKAEIFWKKACDGGNKRGCKDLSYITSTTSCTIGSECTTLAYEFYESKNYSDAIKLFRKGCNKGDAGGCLILGLMYAQGDGVQTDLQEAALLFQKACDGEDGAGCESLGHMHINGFGMKKDYKTAWKFYKMACSYGNAKGCYKSGLLYQVNKYSKDAKQLFRKACNGGYQDACRELKSYR